ncbi:MAG: hypothetical protein Q8P07_02605 [bacterium]|nr:hypothetical protein [bacterium]
MNSNLNVKSLRAISRRGKSLKNKALMKEKKDEQKDRKKLELEAKRQGELSAKKQLPYWIKEVKDAAKDGYFDYELETAVLNGGQQEHINKSSEEYLKAKAEADVARKYFINKKIRSKLRVTRYVVDGGIDMCGDHLADEYLTSFELLLDWK